MLLENLLHFIVPKIDPCGGSFQLQDLPVEVGDLGVLSYFHRLGLHGC
jgi:hypothetical protein